MLPPSKASEPSAPGAPATLAEGRFVVERQLGAGGMGSVWLARDGVLGNRLVAVKVLLPEASSDLGRGRFRREARLMARARISPGSWPGRVPSPSPPPFASPASSPTPWPTSTLRGSSTGI